MTTTSVKMKFELWQDSVKNVRSRGLVNPTSHDLWTGLENGPTPVDMKSLLRRFGVRASRETRLKYGLLGAWGVAILVIAWIAIARFG
jgi:hypothetical protein